MQTAPELGRFSGLDPSNSAKSLMSAFATVPSPSTAINARINRRRTPLLLMAASYVLQAVSKLTFAGIAGHQALSPDYAGIARECHGLLKREGEPRYGSQAATDWTSCVGLILWPSSSGSSWATRSGVPRYPGDPQIAAPPDFVPGGPSPPTALHA